MAASQSPSQSVSQSVNQSISQPIRLPVDAQGTKQNRPGMQVGAAHQAEIPQFIAYAPAPEYYEDEKAIRVWSPLNKIPDHVLDEYISKAKVKFFYNTEQALGMLSWHKFDLNRAYADLPNFVPYPNEWSVEDKVLFEQAFQFHEKNFIKIRQMLPDKTMPNLISYYYGWKKTRTRASLMERQTRRFAAREKTTDSNNPSDDEEVEEENTADVLKPEVKGESGEMDDCADSKNCSCDKEEIEEPKINCCLCNKELRVHGETVSITIDGVVDDFCPNCYVKYKTGQAQLAVETELGDCFYHPTGEQKRILFSYQDVVSLVEGMPEAGDIMLKHLDAQVQDVRRSIQTKKQTLSQVLDKIQPIADQIANLNMDEFMSILPPYEPTDRWSNYEIQLLGQGLRRYGVDFNAISDVIRTKSPDQVRMFYVTRRESLGLEPLVKQNDLVQEARMKKQEDEINAPNGEFELTNSQTARGSPQNNFE